MQQPNFNRTVLTHMRDVRRPLGTTPRGCRQVPVICALDVLDVGNDGADRWTGDVLSVSCFECRARIVGR